MLCFRAELRGRRDAGATAARDDRVSRVGWPARRRRYQKERTSERPGHYIETRPSTYTSGLPLTSQRRRWMPVVVARMTALPGAKARPTRLCPEMASEGVASRVRRTMPRLPLSEAAQ